VATVASARAAVFASGTPIVRTTIPISKSAVLEMTKLTAGRIWMGFMIPPSGDDAKLDTIEISMRLVAAYFDV
jgi:hypothetical protein